MCDDGLAPSVALVHGLIDAQIASGVPAERVLVGGFSQGSTVHTHPLALRGLSACWASPPPKGPSQGRACRLWAARSLPATASRTSLPRGLLGGGSRFEGRRSHRLRSLRLRHAGRAPLSPRGPPRSARTSWAASCCGLATRP